MPVPIPNNNETRSEFMQRCVSFLVNEGTDNEQAVAICSDQWEEKKDFNKIKTEKFNLLKNQTIINK